MKIVISPAKRLSMEADVPEWVGSEKIRFESETQKVIEVARDLDVRDLEQMMGISKELAQLNWQRHKDYGKEGNFSKQAAYLFDGQVYLGLNIKELGKEEVGFLQKNLRILSGLYGILTPRTLIQPYRLEMGVSLGVDGKNKMSDFWREKVTESLLGEMADNEVLVNLASDEYFSVIDKKKLKGRIVTVVFKDRKNDRYKTIVSYTKDARGKMARYIAENKIENVEDIKCFDTGGYMFSEKDSDKENYVFLRG